jgi:D-arginine dehydrogenase
MAEFDIVIVGGGIAGASLGAEVAGHRRTLIVEAEDHCGYHSTGRSAAFYLESYGGAEVAKLTAASQQFLANPPPDFAADGFLRVRGDLHLTREELPQLPSWIETRIVDRIELEKRVPGIRPEWRRALYEPGCADIDVARLHAAYLRRFRQIGGEVRAHARLTSAEWHDDRWIIRLENGPVISAGIVVNAAGAWVDQVAVACGVQPLGFLPKRRTMVQLRVGRRGLRDLPLIDDSEGTFYFKGEGDNTIWLSPHDEIETEPCDAAPEEFDVATAIDRFESVVDWPVEGVERTWAGLRTFAPDRLPVYGFDPHRPNFFWCAGQGGFGIQTSPAAARVASALLLDKGAHGSVRNIDPMIFSPSRFEMR